MSLIIFLASVCVLLLMLSFFFSGSEAGFLALNREIYHNDLKSGVGGAGEIKLLVDNLPLLLMTTLLGNNLVNISLVSASRKLWIESIGDRWLGLYLLFSTALFLIAGEIIPKITFMKYSNTLLYRTSMILNFFFRLFYPLTYVLSKLATPFIDRLFKGFGDKVSRNEFKEIVGDVHSQGELSEQERTLMENFSFFTQTRISEIMTPLIDLFVIHKKSTVKSLFEQMGQDTELVPVYDKRVDDVIGFIDIKEVYFSPLPKRLIKDFITEPVYIPESVTLDRIFGHLLDYKNKSIVVINEYGGCSGVVTWRDVLDNLFGFKYDFADNSKKYNIRKKSDHEFEIDSSIDIDSFNNIFKQKIVKDGFETLGGFLNHLNGEIPQKGEVLTYGQLRFTIIKNSRTSVDLVEMVIEKNPKKESSDVEKT